MLFYDVFVYLFPLNVCSYLSVNSFWGMKNSTLSVSASGGLSYQLASFSLGCSWTRKPYFRVSMLTPNKIINIIRGKNLIFFDWGAAWSPACKTHPLLCCPPSSLTSCALGQRFLCAGSSFDVLTFCQTGFVFLKSVKNFFFRDGAPPSLFTIIDFIIRKFLSIISKGSREGGEANSWPQLTILK